MKKLVTLFFAAVLSATMLQAQKYASGKWATLIDKTFVTDKDIKELKGYTEHMFTALSLDTPSLCIRMYQKDTDCVILMTLEQDGIKKITDVLAIKGVKKNQQFLVSQCTINNEIANDLIVLVQNPQRNSLKAKALKAWRADRDKIHFKKAGIAQLTCLFEDP
jgi:hypothetical protein